MKAYSILLNRLEYLVLPLLKSWVLVVLFLIGTVTGNANLMQASGYSGLGNFDELMGKNTKHWEYVKKSEDQHLLQVCKSVFEKNKSALGKTTGLYKIPPIVHFIWLGPRSFPPQSVENVRSWMAQHPDWIFRFWTDRVREPPCRGMEVCKIADFPFLFLKDCFEESNNWGEKSDVLRYEILYQQGGIYVDHDANALRSFDSLHRGLDFYCGLETPHPSFAGRNITIGIGLLASRPNHPLILAAIQKIKSHWKQLGDEFPGVDGYSRTELVMRRTYMPLTEILLTQFDKDGNVDIVLPAAYFLAKSGLKSIYSKHFYSNTWASENPGQGNSEKALGKVVLKAAQRVIRAERLMIIASALSLFGILFALWSRYAKKNSGSSNGAVTLQLYKNRKED